MPLLLTNSLSTGQLDQNCNSYAHVKIMKTEHNAVCHYIVLQCQYGNDDGYGNWTPGVLSPSFFTIDGADYLSIVSGAVLEGETAYQAVSRLLYQWLVDKGHFSGTYV